MSLSPCPGQMLFVAKGCNLTTLEEAYDNYMNHYDCFFLIKDFALQKAHFHNQLMECGLIEIVDNQTRLKQLTIDEALAIVKEYTIQARVTALNISKTSQEILNSLGIETVQQLLGLSAIELGSLPDVDQNMVKEIRSSLSQTGLDLRPDCISFQKMFPEKYEETLQSWDDIRRMLLLEQDEGSFPRECFESIIDDLFEFAYNLGLEAKR